MPNGRKPGQVGPQPEPRRDQPRKTLEERSAARRTRRAKQGKPVNQPRPLSDIHVAKIVTPDPMIFPPKLRLALQYYLDTVPRDKERAAKRAGMDVDEFRKHLYSPGVIDYLRDQEALIDEKAAELRAQARVLTEDMLDTRLVECAMVAAKKGDSKPLELGYERIGVRRDGNFITQQPASSQTRPQIYRVLEQTVTRTEQVTQREITAAKNSDGGLPLPRALASDVLEY